MANKNFVVKNGLTVGNLAIDAESGNLTTSGDLTVSSIRTDSFFYANGAPFSTAGAGGYTGSAGPEGAPGPTGFTGSKGADGTIGVDGYTGSTGAAGFTGSQGTIGTDGYTGSAGLQGYTGSQGGAEFVFQNSGFNYSVDGFADTTYPTLTVVRGQLYYFNLTNVTSSHPLALRLSSGDTAAVPGTTGNDPISGNFGNGTTPTTVIYQVPFDAPSSIVYQCVFHSGMIGIIEIVDQTGYTGSSGIQGDTGFVGSKGDTGLGFRIAKTYSSVAALTADTSPTDIEAGEFALIETGSVEDPDNSQLYLWTGTAYTYVTDLSGAAGITGQQGDTGFTGSAGTSGDTGFVGSGGELGYTGSVGYTGSDGTIGTDGYTGSQGVTGFTGSVGLLDWTPITANYTVSNRERLLLNSSTGSFTLTLPTAPATGTYIQLTDGANLATDPVTVERNGSTIENLSSNLILDVPNATFEFIYDGTTWQFTSTSGPRGDVGYTGSVGFMGSAGLSDWIVVNSTHTAVDKQRLIVDTSAGEFSLTLPATPAIGTYVQITDGADLLTNPLTVVRNGSTIEGLATDFVMDVPNATFEFIYDGATWQVTSTVGPRGEFGYTGSQGVTGFTGSVGLLDWTTISADHIASNRERLLLNSTAGPFTLTLPATPATGTYIQLTDGANLATHNVTIVRNGSTIENIDQDLALDTPNATFEFIYDGSTWQVTSTAGPRGLPGYTGSAGTGGGSGDGYTGSQGDTGFTGSQGEFGYTGSAGTGGGSGDGYTGSQGDTGFTGSQGEFGYTGSIGFAGSSGAQGDTGFVGSQGRQGGAEFVFQNSGFNYSVDGFADDTYPTLTVIRGQLYYFNLTNVTSSHPLALRLSSGDTAAVPGTTGNDPISGNFGNGTTPTTVVYQVPFDAPSSIVYQCVFHSSMIGTIEIVDQTGYTGSQGDTGLGFRIAKSYVSVAALTADTAPTGIVAGEFAIIETGSVEDADNSQLYLWTGTAYTYVTDLSGAAGITGPAGGIGYAGSTGFTGSTGAQGDTGFVGSAGTPGEAAAIGYTGSQGFVGSAGAQGVPGIATSSLTVDTFAGTGTQVAFELSVTPTGINQTLVNIDGVAQLKSSYSLSGSTLTFSEAPANGADIEVTVFVYGTSTFVNRIYAGDGVATEFAVTAGVTADSIIVSDNGIVQRPVIDYSVTGSTITFTVAPLTGSSIQIREIPAGTGPAGPTGYTGSASTGGTTAAALAGYSLIFGG